MVCDVSGIQRQVVKHIKMLSETIKEKERTNEDQRERPCCGIPKNAQFGLGNDVLVVPITESGGGGKERMMSSGQF